MFPLQIILNSYDGFSVKKKLNYRDMSNIGKMCETTLEIFNKNWKAASVFNIAGKNCDHSDCLRVIGNNSSKLIYNYNFNL